MAKLKLLVDLKPALDGYAGIPQESRLLFAGLRHLDDDFVTDGLLQHGSGFITTSPHGAQSRDVPPHVQVMGCSRTVVSFCRNAVKTYVPGLPKSVQRYFALQELRWWAWRGRAVPLGSFASDLFDDFLWRHLFAKTLAVADKERVVRARFRTLAHGRKQFHQTGLASFSRLIKPRHVQVQTQGYDVLIAQTPFPARVSPGTQLVIRYHDAFPILMPHTISDVAFHQASHFAALRQNVADGALFACVSDATRADLLRIFPQAQAVTIPNMVCAAFRPSQAPRERVRAIIINRLAEGDGRAPQDEGEDFPYLLMVSTLEPRKNHALLISAWERLKYAGEHPDLKLILVGNRGWKDEPLLAQMRPWQKRGALYHLSHVPADELRVLYSHAALTVCPSFAEGFDYSGVEAMRCGGLVAASDIPVHREIYGAAAAYFNPYHVAEASYVMARLLSRETQQARAQRRGEALAIARRYDRKAILPLWRDFLTKLT